MYIDGHCHVASTEFIPRSFAEGIVKNMSAALGTVTPAVRSKLMDMYMSTMQDLYCDELIAEMAEAGIGRSVLLLPDFTYALKDCSLTIAEMFERHRQILERHRASLLVFAGVDPRWGRDGVALFERGITEYGFHGLKIYPPCGYSPSEKELYPFYEICSARRLPVLIHTGATSPALSFETANPVLVDRSARDFPHVNFILAHASTWYVEESVMMATNRPNVYLDISGYAASPTKRLNPFFTRGINHKIIFGTDWPIFRLQAQQKDLVERLTAQDGPFEELGSRDRDLIMGMNMAMLVSGSTSVGRAATTSASEPGRECFDG